MLEKLYSNIFFGQNLFHVIFDEILFIYVSGSQLIYVISNQGNIVYLSSFSYSSSIDFKLRQWFSTFCSSRYTEVTKIRKQLYFTNCINIFWFNRKTRLRDCNLWSSTKDLRILASHKLRNTGLEHDNYFNEVSLSSKLTLNLILSLRQLFF